MKTKVLFLSILLLAQLSFLVADWQGCQSSLLNVYRLHFNTYADKFYLTDDAEYFKNGDGLIWADWKNIGFQYLDGNHYYPMFQCTSNEIEYLIEMGYDNIKKDIIGYYLQFV